LQISEGAITDDQFARGFVNCRVLFQGRRALRLRHPPAHSLVARTPIPISSPCPRRSTLRSSVKRLLTICSMATVSTPQLFHRTSTTRWTLRTAQIRSQADDARSVGPIPHEVQVRSTAESRSSPRRCARSAQASDSQALKHMSDPLSRCPPRLARPPVPRDRSGGRPGGSALHSASTARSRYTHRSASPSESPAQQ
jgi:hypothetical protein